MPIIPPVGAPPYDEIETVLNFARVIANDCGLSLAGNLLSDTQPYTMTMLNLAWRKLQDRLGNNSIASFPQEAILTGIPAQQQAAFNDPAINAYISFTEYNDGVSLFTGLFLPQDMEIPLRIWQRVSGQNAEFIPVPISPDGIATLPKTGMIRTWQWQDDKIWFPGASQVLDMRIRYKKFLQDLVTPTTNLIPIIRCAVALAYLVVEIFAAGRGSTILPVFHQEKEDAIKQLINSTTRMKQRTNFRRIPYSRRGMGNRF